MTDLLNDSKNPQHATPEPEMAPKTLRNWPLNFFFLLFGIVLLKKVIGSSKDLNDHQQVTTEPHTPHNVQSATELDAAPTVLAKCKKYCFTLLINLLLWIFISVGMFLVLLVGNWLGFTETLPAKVASTANFFDAKFLTPLIIGILVMIVTFLAIEYIISKLREKVPGWNKINREVIPDNKFREIFHAEIVGQVNNIANLAMFSGLALFYDQSQHGGKLLEASSVQPVELVTTALVLYFAAAIFYWKFTDD